MSDDFEESHLREHPFRLAAARQSTFPKGTASAVAAKFPAQPKGVPLGELSSVARLRGFVSKTPPVKMQCRSVRRRSGITP